MKKINDIKGVIFDYGGTIDTNSRHWAEVLWSQYVKHGIPVAKDSFREAYVFGERTLAKYPYVRPDHNFYDVLLFKCKLQMEYLALHEYLEMDERKLQHYALSVAESSYSYVQDILKITRPVVKSLSEALLNNLFTIYGPVSKESYFQKDIPSVAANIASFGIGMCIKLPSFISILQVIGESNSL